MAMKKSIASIILAFLISFNLIVLPIVSACEPSCTNPVPIPPSTTPTVPKPSPPSTTPTVPKQAKCPKDTLKLGVCANVLKGLLSLTVGKPPVTPCCTLIKDLADLEAAACLCTVLKANVLGNNLNVPVALSLLLNVCSKKAPTGFQCP